MCKRLVCGGGGGRLSFIPMYNDSFIAPPPVLLNAIICSAVKLVVLLPPPIGTLPSFTAAPSLFIQF